MTHWLIAWSARNKAFVLLVTAIAVGFEIQTLYHVPVDAIPDLSDTQVIVYSRWDRSPDLIEDQVTYPITTALLGTPKVKAIRGFSDFGYSFVYVIFEDGTDVYWARSRVLEYLSKVLPKLPEGVRTEIGPDATGVGWVYQYALVDRTGRHDLAALRSFQDWYLRYWLQAVPGVAEVASIGGFEKQYQVQVDPNRLLAYKIPIERVLDAVRDGNADAGGGLIEIGGAEYMVRARGYARSVGDLGKIVVGGDAKGTPVLLRDLATVTTGPAVRRGIAELDGEGGTVGAIVVMRSGENALATIERVKAKIEEVRGSLPEGVEIVPTYDRSGLIEESIATLKNELIAALIIVSAVILLFTGTSLRRSSRS
jgi:Cu(I)/Ag(I) efflux system membrane protein CusA/SilA